MTKSEITRAYRDKFGMEMPTLKLARIMQSENPLMFNSVEQARSFLRSIEGKCIRHIKVTHPYPDRPKNPYKLPKSEEKEFLPYEISGHNRIGIFSDVHVPYHSISCLTAAITYCKNEKIDALILNGDTIDCYGLSRWEKDPKKRDFKYELDTFKSLVNILEKQLKCKIYLKIGNHEERYERFLLEKAGELKGVEEFEFNNILKARARGIEIIGDKRPMTLANGHLYGIHGHEYVGGISAPVNPARGLFLKAKVSCFQGHNHQTSEHTEPTLSDKMVTTWSLGCMSELHPAYMPLNKWNHGFGIVDIDGNEYEFRNKRVLKGKVL